MPRWSRVAAAAFGTYIALADLVPPRIRYGYVHPISKWLFARDLPLVGSVATLLPEGRASISHRDADVTAALAVGELDIGGIGTVIEMLARELPELGVRPIVVCPDGGARGERLRALGIQVACERDQIAAAFERADVIELHSAPPEIEDAALTSGLPLVVAMHNTEIHFTRARWRRMRTLLDQAVAGVAVSEIVRRYHARHLPAQLRRKLEVVPNGAPLMRAVKVERTAARAALEAAVGAKLSTDIVYVCLARYDAQKNIAGMVSSFLRFAEGRPDVHLVCAGDPSDWAEVRRADALRKCSSAGDRVHFLGNSDAATLLTAGDVFLLDSFFEGWPVAATEAAAAGLPLVLSDVGGAGELVARDSMRSRIVPNPCGEAAAVSDSRVARARRHARRQVNADALVGALADVARLVRAGAPYEGPQEGGLGVMVEGHATLLRASAQAATATQRGS